MAAPTSPDLSPASALLMVFAAVLGPTVAPYASAYTLILIGWFAGLLVGTYLKPPDARRMPVLVFAFVTLVVVIGITVPLSNLLAHYASATIPTAQVEASGLFLGVAVAIPAIGHRWMTVIQWLLARFWRRGPGSSNP